MSVEVPVGEFFKRLDEIFKDDEIKLDSEESTYIRVDYFPSKSRDVHMAQERIFRNYKKSSLDKLIEFFNQYK